MEHSVVGVALTQRLSLRLRAANPWVMDLLLATSFLLSGTHTAAGEQ